MARVDVTAADIAAGKPKHCHTCPVALAIGRLLAPGWSVAVLFSEIEIAHDRRPGPVRLRTPLRAAVFVLDFDCGDPVKPFGFDLDVPAEALA